MESEQDFINDLDRWLESKEHTYSCAGYDYWRCCCLDEGESGREFILDWLRERSLIG